MKCILSYDIGTGGVKASLYDINANSLTNSFIEYETYYLNDGFHEQNPQDWWSAIKNATKDMLSRTEDLTPEIMAIGVSGHSLGVVPVNKNGNLLISRTPLWSDSRARKQADLFFGAVDYDSWYTTTGNGFPAHYYSIFKIMWYMHNQKELYDNTYKFLGTKDYINFILTGVLATDYSYASGSGVYDLVKKCYRDDYLKASGIDKSKFAQIVCSNEIIGYLKRDAAKDLGLKEKIPIVCGGVDNACMALGAGCYKDGDAYASLGSSSWITVSINKPFTDIEKKPYVFSHCVNDMFIPSAAVFSSGRTLKWVLENLFPEFSKKENPYAEMDKLSEFSKEGANRLFFNPHLAGGSSLDYSPNIRGGYIGLDLSHRKADIARATLEGIVYDLKTAYDVLTNQFELSPNLLMVGGGSKSKTMRQLYSDILGVNIVKTDVMQDAASLGAAALAAVGIGFWKDYSSVISAHKNVVVTQPDKVKQNKYNNYYHVYKEICKMQSKVGDMLNKINID